MAVLDALALRAQILNARG